MASRNCPKVAQNWILGPPPLLTAASMVRPSLLPGIENCHQGCEHGGTRPPRIAVMETPSRTNRILEKCLGIACEHCFHTMEFHEFGDFFENHSTSSPTLSLNDPVFSELILLVCVYVSSLMHKSINIFFLEFWGGSGTGMLSGPSSNEGGPSPG